MKILIGLLGLLLISCASVGSASNLSKSLNGGDNLSVKCNGASLSLDVVDSLNIKVKCNPQSTPTSAPTNTVPTATFTPVPVSTVLPSNNSTALMLADSAPNLHEGCLWGSNVSNGYDWQYGAVTHLVAPNEPAAQVDGGIVYDHCPNGTYQTSVPNPSNVRVEVSNDRGYALTSTGWKLIQSASLGGFGFGDWNVYFQGGCGSGSSMRTETDGTSWLIASDESCVMHFWVADWPRPLFPSGTQCVWSTYNVRLIKDNSSGPDNLDFAHFMASTSMDEYPGTTATSSSAPSLGIGIFERISRNWRPVNVTTCNAAQLTQFPPPF